MWCKGLGLEAWVGDWPGIDSPEGRRYTCGMLRIENHVPMPKTHQRESYPFYDMRVGDSFLITEEGKVKNARSAAWMFSQRHEGVRFSCRKAAGGWRMWRIA